MQPFLQYSAPMKKIFFLFLNAFAGIIVMQFFVSIAAGFAGADPMQSVVFLRISSVLQGLFLFLLPALSLAIWTESAPKAFLTINRAPNLDATLLRAVLLLVVSAPVVMLLTTFNQSIVLPHWLSGVEQWMRQMEDSAMDTTNILLGEKNAFNFIINLVLIAGFAAVCEELFFRGVLQQFLYQWSRNGHSAVWISALIFSAMHVQFYGFIPRLVLGALLGYIFLYTHNLWLAILVHFLNNALALFNFYYVADATDFSQVQTYPTTLSAYVLAACSVVATIYMLIRLRNYAPVIQKDRV